jgi:hypothetical protein
MNDRLIKRKKFIITKRKAIVIVILLFIFQIFHTKNLNEEQELAHMKSLMSQPAIDYNSIIPVFYNVFTKSEKDIDLVRSIVTEQLSYLKPQHEVFVRSIGTRFEIENTIRIQHDNTGWEIGTLSLLWDYCKKNPDKKVAYIHSKGSYHYTESNAKLRKLLTRGALSEECANLPSSCNVCSWRMSPLPHPHTPGNMWLARCEYIKRLIDPYQFEAQMAFVRDPKDPPPCVGKGRFAAEHWVHSHPNVMPCDLATDKKYTWGHNKDNHKSLNEDFEIELQQAPRFKLEVYKKKNNCVGVGTSLNDRLMEYNNLYSENVTESWWGWNFFQKEG